MLYAIADTLKCESLEELAQIVYMHQRCCQLMEPHRKTIVLTHEWSGFVEDLLLPTKEEKGDDKPLTI